ncbi:hypothetical protein G6F46_013135 [Rhizopus delemar]|nr:hypothetical protein G6F46_013135 [Rhizopus delemar]
MNLNHRHPLLILFKVDFAEAEDHYGEAPVLAFLDIKSAYDTVDRAIIWRALETYISEPLLGLLQSLFDKVSIQVLINGHSSRSFWPKTGVLQGSILSPFLYSIYINSLPAVLRAVPLPISSRVFGTMPRREYSGLWINCLLYADDVVIIAAPDVMPRLLRRAAQHSMELGYRWNPAKCVVVNSPTIYGAPPLRLYGDPIPIADSFPYLGIPFDSKGAIATDQLLKRNIASALPAMRNTLQPLGLHAPSFSRLTASRLYAIFIRPKLEYGSRPMSTSRFWWTSYSLYHGVSTHDIPSCHARTSPYFGIEVHPTYSLLARGYATAHHSLLY